MPSELRKRSSEGIWLSIRSAPDLVGGISGESGRQHLATALRTELHARLTFEAGKRAGWHRP